MLPTRILFNNTFGQLNAQFQNLEYGIPGAGAILQTRGNIGFNSAVIAADNQYYGLFALDTFNVTNRFAITAGARCNVANVATQDLSDTDPADTGSHNYDRLNPTVGATYEFAKALTAFGSYSETNRAPTSLETNGADPARPCLLETALVADPSLKQVVAHTIEAGARGRFDLPQVGGAMTYKAAHFTQRLTTTSLACRVQFRLKVVTPTCQKLYVKASRPACRTPAVR